MKRHIDMYGVPMDLGADRRGVDMGPSATRIANVVQRVRELGHVIEDLGNVTVATMEEAALGNRKAKYESEIVDCCQRLALRVANTVRNNRFPLVVGGDHSIAVGTITGISNVYRERGEKIGLIWFDAHADMNTPKTSPSGNVHGMPLSAVLGHGSAALTQLGGFGPKVSPENTVLIGIRSLDTTERAIVKKSGVRAFTMKEIDRMGMGAVIDQAIATATSGTAGFHLSFDLDGMDPSIAPGTGTPEPGGVTYREAHLMMELIADSEKLLGLEMVEINAILDDRNKTAELAVGLIASALGRRIL
jgi:arginase